MNLVWVCLEEARKLHRVTWRLETGGFPIASPVCGRYDDDDSDDDHECLRVFICVV